MRRAHLIKYKVWSIITFYFHFPKTKILSRFGIIAQIIMLLKNSSILRKCFSWKNSWSFIRFRFSQPLVNSFWFSTSTSRFFINKKRLEYLNFYLFLKLKKYFIQLSLLNLKNISRTITFKILFTKQVFKKLNLSNGITLFLLDSAWIHILEAIKNYFSKRILLTRNLTLPSTLTIYVIAWKK